MRVLLVAAAISAPSAFASAAQPSAVAPATPAHQEVFLPMRDGTVLAANVYLPAGAGPWPVVLQRTPYLKDLDPAKSPPQMLQMLVEAVHRYTSSGYAYVVEDVRGKGHSRGAYTAFSDDIPDGYDTVEWIAKQNWSNGKVGVEGASALGITANMAAIAAPPHLVAAYVIVAPSERSDNTYMGGVLKDQDTLGWERFQGASSEALDSIRRGAVKNLLSERNDMAQGMPFIRIPIYNVGGWYDIFSAGNVYNFQYLQNHGAKGARGNQKLFMGPFGHGPLSGDLAYSDAERGPHAADQALWWTEWQTIVTADEMRWWDYWLKGIHNGIMDEPAVHLEMMGAARRGDFSPKNRVIAAANWPPAHHDLRFYPTPDQRLTTAPPARDGVKVSYQFDPAHPVKTVGGANLLSDRGPMDQRAIPARQDYLRFETSALDKDLAIAGHVSVEVWGATDGPDTDFMAKLVDVYPDGYEALVLDAPIRARFRNGRMPDDVKMMTPNVPELLTIDMWNTAISFEKGHRIELVITSSNAPRFEINRNNGAPAGDLTTPARVATNSIYMDRRHPTALVLPVIDSNDGN